MIYCATLRSCRTSCRKSESARADVDVHICESCQCEAGGECVWRSEQHGVTKMKNAHQKRWEAVDTGKNSAGRQNTMRFSKESIL